MVKYVNFNLSIVDHIHTNVRKDESEMFERNKRTVSSEDALILRNTDITCMVCNFCALDSPKS